MQVMNPGRIQPAAAVRRPAGQTHLMDAAGKPDGANNPASRADCARSSLQRVMKALQDKSMDQFKRQFTRDRCIAASSLRRQKNHQGAFFHPQTLSTEAAIIIPRPLPARSGNSNHSSNPPGLGLSVRIEPPIRNTRGDPDRKTAAPG